MPMSPRYSADERGSLVELDLRVELLKTLLGASDELAKGRIGLIRRMRRDTAGKLIKCSCRDTVSDEPDRDFYCRYCLGHGYFWDESNIVYYKNDRSLKEAEQYYFYIRDTVEPTREDYLIELKVDLEGRPVDPIERLESYKILECEPFRADSGRVEYWRFKCALERKWSAWYGTASRQHQSITRT